MNQISIVQQDSKTMTSMEIAELTGKAHAHVRRDILNMFDALKKDASTFGYIYFDKYSREQSGYELPYDETICLLTGYDANARMAVIKRWRELEAAAPAKIAAPKRAPDPALAASRTAKALQMNIESASAICARFPSLGEQSHQVIFSKIVGGGVIPLPLLENRTYTATEVGVKLVASANAIGRLANAHNLKTSEYGIFVLDKSQSSDKQVETFRYNDAGVSRLADLLGATA